jgi:aryl-alcohol dehydrogenase-like predicted oxidoreductase
VPQLAISWVLHQEGVTAAIAGSRNAEHVRENASAGSLGLTAGVREELERLIPLGPTVAGAA